MSEPKDPSTESIAFDTAIHQMERFPPIKTHMQDVADRALRLLDAMVRAGFTRDEISDYFKARVLLVGDPDIRDAVAGCCARAMTIRYRMGTNGGSSAADDEQPTLRIRR